MNVLESIFTRIFPANHPAIAGVNQTENIPAPMAAPTATLASETAKPQIDVATIIGGMAKNNPQATNWRTSIVDLMKVLGLDSSLASRIQLAKELNFTGDRSDTAAMNTWLIQAVMEKIAENGGQIPEELKH